MDAKICGKCSLDPYSRVARHSERMLNHHSSLHLPKSHRNEEVSDGIQCRQRGFSPSFRFLTSPGGMPVTIRAVMDPGQFLEPGTREHYSSDCSAGLQMLVPKGGFSHQKTKQLFH
ncbi:uncharacterized protein LOC143681162 isoform X4 [Tamandua tetradactyla]|uniref:uncharacterized protein LOC143681162 isoform X4 n=1 Tax=Tamandua tetradactyla TaxID=48850 RepID=UPI0040542F99